VSFSPDGKRLASGSWDNTVKVWDARPWTPELKAQFEVRGLFNFLSDKALLKQDLIEAIRADRQISEPVRFKALALAQDYIEDANRLNGASWKVVRSAEGLAEGYRQALCWAERAGELKRHDGRMLNTLGVAQYRTGQYEQALKTLSQSEQLNAKDRRFGGRFPSDLAFQAMAHHQLGHKEEAAKLLVRLRKIMKQDRWAEDAEARGFLREAEVLIEGKLQAPHSSKNKSG
jgi:tetratricopeptide (TPR) repeat protein